MKKYYAVKFGRNPGIYESLEEAQSQIIGYKNGKMKAFVDRARAEAYLSDDNFYVVVRGRTIGIFRSADYFNKQIKNFPDAKYGTFPRASIAAVYLDENIHAQKYYVVRKGRETGIFVDEKIYLRQTKGFKDAQCKSYKNIESAILYLLGREDEIGRQTQMNNQDEAKFVNGQRKPYQAPSLSKIDGKTEYVSPECVIYVDGSFNPEDSLYSMGAVMLMADKCIEMSQVFNDNNWAKYRNIAGEIFATTTAVQEAVNRGAKSILINHDLVGLSHCLREDANINADIWKLYRETMGKLSKEANLEFQLVKGHSGVTFNTRADQLAKGAIKHKQNELKVDVVDLNQKQTI